MASLTHPRSSLLSAILAAAAVLAAPAVGAQELTVRPEAVLHRAGEHPVRLAGRLDHLRRLGGAPGERPFAQDMLARLERGHRHRRVEEVGGADVDRVDRVVREQTVDA